MNKKQTKAQKLPPKKVIIKQTKAKKNLKLKIIYRNIYKKIPEMHVKCLFSETY